MGNPAECVLVVDDSKANLLALSKFISDFGFQTIECNDGEEAWQFLSSDFNENVVCVFSDIMMPKVSGLELLSRSKDNDKTKFIPFVMISSLGDKDSIIESLSRGAGYYMQKPATLEKITACLQDLFPDRGYMMPGTEKA